VVAFSRTFAAERPDGDEDRQVTFRVMGNLPVIVWDMRRAGGA
jgi:hypothetical protein